MPRAQFCKSRAFAYNNAFKELFSPLPTLIWAVATCHEMCAILQGWTFLLQDPNAQKRRAKNVQNGRKSAQKNANGRKSKKRYL